MFLITPVDVSHHEKIQTNIDQKTKPVGALGQLEMLANQLAKITGPDTINLSGARMLVFAGDHGIAQQGVSIAPPEVTQQMVANFVSGGAAINCFCRVNDMAISVIDAGMLAKVDHPDVIDQSLGNGTQNIAEAPAMSIITAEQGLAKGAALVREFADTGTNVFGFGEMGIGNTSSASALLSVFCGYTATETVGRGTGISDDVLAKKIQLVDKAIQRHQAVTGFELDAQSSVLDTLAGLGGFEIVQMVGAMLGAAERQCIILVDGFIASIAALAAVRFNPDARGYMVFCHHSEERAHRYILDDLQAIPLLNLGLRLGEGTGAALAYPLLKAAAAFFNDMASFADAGVTEV
jgi:nicotinate-nucleotide--dimethylbenzimidazole phosphoribosyltransferase